MGVKGAVWPLVGRDGELAAIQALLEGAGVTGVVVAGAAGVGKTRLASEVLDRAQAQGFAARWAVATKAASAIPFGALAPLLPDPGRRAADQVQPLRWAAAALQEASGGRRLVLGVDDAHLLDHGSAALIHQLAATSAAFVVLTVRSQEPVPDAILGLWKDELADRLELGPLSRHEVEQLLCAVLGDQVDALTLYRLSTAAQGNSLLLRELVLAGLELGRLEQHDGVWRWSGPLGVTHRLADLIEARLGRLDGQQRAVLELLAIGEPLSPSVLGQATAPGVLEALERQRLVVVEPEGRRLEVRFAHPLYREVLRRRTPVLRARTVYRQLAGTLEGLGMRRREDLLRVAAWRLEAGAPASAGLLTAAAGKAARADDVLAERLARAAVEMGGGVEAGLALGRALYAQRRFQEAEQMLAGLAGLELSDRQRVDLAVQRSDNLRLLHRCGEATAELEAAYEVVTEPHLRDRLVTALARSLVGDGRVREALEVASAVLTHDPADPAALAQAIWITAWALVLSGRAADALAVTDLRGRLGDRWEDQTSWSHELIESMRVAACLSLGRCDDAEVIADACYRRSLASQEAWGMTFWAFELRTVALARGRVRTAVRWGQDGLAQVPSLGDAALLHLQLVLPLAIAGDIDGAVASLGEADTERTARSRLALLGVEAARRWIEAGQGNRSTAVKLTLRAADLAESMGVNDSYAVALHDAARLGGAAEVADRLRALAAVVDGPVVPLYAAHAEALATADAGGLGEVAASFEALGAMLLAAEAATEAAVAHRAAGHKDAARAWAARAVALARRCEGARTPALRLLDQPPELTQREHEVAGLAAAGQSNRAIAAQLMLSVRTVDNHLQHVFDKLGVHSRHALARLLRPPS